MTTQTATAKKAKPAPRNLQTLWQRLWTRPASKVQTGRPARSAKDYYCADRATD